MRAWALLLLAAPAALAQPLPPVLEHQVEVAAGGHDRTVRIDLDVEAPGPGLAYLKVVPREGNPLLDNGTPSQGWWLQVQAGLQSGGTNGSAVVPLGTVEAGRSYVLRLDIHVPREALQGPAIYQVNLAFAVASETGGGGSGGTLDRSQSIRVLIVVVEPVQESSSRGVPAGLPALAGVVGARWMGERKRGSA